jgi:hypothetical protein
MCITCYYSRKQKHVTISPKEEEGKKERNVFSSFQISKKALVASTELIFPTDISE